MCGIAGWATHGDDGVPAREVLGAMTDALAHRGPDDAGSFIARVPTTGGQVALGHRRLAIIDLDGGRQPMRDDDAGLALVYNGELYNFQTLRGELECMGYRFVSHSDTEVVLRAYQAWGDACVERFNGMFAFALWDGPRARLVLARDPFGEKPLFLYEGGGSLVFGSEIKALLAFPGVSTTVDRGAVWDYLAYRYVPGPATLFAGIRKLPPGTVACWAGGRLTARGYYTPPDRHPVPSRDATGDPVDEFAAALRRAVQSRMVSDVPFGAFLSGGLDSSAVVALMDPDRAGGVNTFAVGFDDDRYSELPYARAVATTLRTSHHEVIVNPDHLIDELPALIRFRDAPVSEPSDVALYLLAKTARRTVKMVLTGEGADEVLGGYPKHRYEGYARAYQAIPAVVRRTLVEPLVHALPYRFRRVKTAVAALGLSRPEDRWPRWFGALAPIERSRLVAGESVRHALSALPFNVAATNSPLRQILYFDQTSWLPDNLLERGDRMTMAASLEARMPFLDRNLVALVSTLPDRYRVRGRVTKWLLREAMKSLLPREVLDRRKVGFRVPVNDWFRGPMREYLHDQLLGSDAITREYYRGAVLRRLVNEHVSGRQNHEKLLWALLNLEIWHRQYAGSGLAAVARC